MKKINIHNEANINGNGTHTKKNCKPVICIDTGEVFTSAADAAEHVGVHFSMMSAACLGRVRTCKGKRYCYLSQAPENLNSIVTRLREVSAMESDAKRWREYQAEQNRLRKEEERRQQAIAKAAAKVSSLVEACTKYESKLTEAMMALDVAQAELASLRGNENTDAA